MSNLVTDFIESIRYQEGYGFFEGDQEAMRYAHRITKRQINKYEKFGIIPKDFIVWLEDNYLVLPKNGKKPSYRDMSMDDLLTLLRRSDYRSEHARSTCEHLYKNLILSKVPELRNNFAEGDFVWKNLGFYTVPTSTSNQPQAS